MSSKDLEVKTTFGGGSSGFQCKKIMHARSDIEDLGIPAVLRGYQTQSDGDVVLSTTFPME